MPAQYFLKQSMIRKETLEMRSFLEWYSDISDDDLYLMYVSPVSKGFLSEFSRPLLSFLQRNLYAYIYIARIQLYLFSGMNLQLGYPHFIPEIAANNLEMVHHSRKSIKLSSIRQCLFLFSAPQCQLVFMVVI
jgi:hypothetical protein